MGVTIISEHQYSTIFQAFAEVENNIYIISPFINIPIAKQLANLIIENNVKCTVITRFKRQDFMDGVSQLNALEELLRAGADIFALRKLHTKLYIVDKEVAIIGSANLTTGGFRSNHELSIMFNNEKDIVAELTNYYKDLLNEIIKCDNSKVTQELIDFEKNEVNKLVQKTNLSCKTSSYVEYGADIKEKAILDGRDVVQESFVLDDEEIDEGIWLKFEGVASSRYNNKEKYKPFIPTKIGRAITCYPENKKPRSVKNGDYIYIAVLSEDQFGKQMPIIVARGRSYGYADDQIADEQLLKENNWIKDWPAYCILYNMERLDTEIINGITHSQIITAMQNQTYESTKGREVSIEKLKTSHLQKSTIRITNATKKYIDGEFDKLSAKYGIINY